MLEVKWERLVGRIVAPTKSSSRVGQQFPEFATEVFPEIGHSQDGRIPIVNNGAEDDRSHTPKQLKRSTIRIVVIAREALTRQSLVSLLSEMPEHVVAQYAEDGPGIDGLIAAFAPDVLVVDVEGDRPEPNSVVARAMEASPSLAVAILTPESDSELAALWMSAGARACIAKNSSSLELQNAIRWIAAGFGWISPLLLPRMGNEIYPDAKALAISKRLSLLTSRELDVLGLMVEGHDQKSAARQLDCSVGTVRTHMSSILKKLHVRSAGAAISLAYAAGLQPMRFSTRSNQF